MDTTTPLRILHLGLGAFHRAHQAAYLQDLHDAGDRRWTIVAGNIRPDPADVSEALRAQGCAYTLETVTPDGERAYRRIGAIGAVVPFVPGLAPLVTQGADPVTRIVSFTVTEAGYFLDTRGELDLSSQELRASLEDTRRGRAGATIYSVLAAILRARRGAGAGAGALTLLCCDNLRHNGERVHQGLAAFLVQAGEAELAAWMEENASFPNAMVDRITPRATPELRQRVLAATGRDDPAAVMSESYIEWVIEDDFRNGRPCWEQAGARLVASVTPYEEAKIRILNASHSCIAWAGALLGYHSIHEAIRDPRIAALVRDYVTNAVFDCLRPSPVDLEAYRDAVIARFSSDAVRDTVERVLADSLAKLPGFIVPTIRERMARGLALDAVTPLPALYLAFLWRWREGLVQADYRDAAFEPGFEKRVLGSSDQVAAFCAEPAIWGDLAGSAILTAAVRTAHLRILPLAQAVS
ncbi:D-arabinitol 4-dehydrogenase [Massilia sp. ST3]|uniref:D-arabinitol 4-dehydrogenase n=1 Tax=Massilia sp. ST3 TaxID=2824903 RepID=UPI001B81E4F2|nr:D-arabinitol 4-dehydrogenase [Massilia sp. ST3]MBQ5947929.1 mannitol dehydrogenase family protein [Massilia sp. ST3]